MATSNIAKNRVIIDPEKGPILTPEAAGDKARIASNTTTTLAYDVIGTAEVKGGQLIITDDLKPSVEADALVRDDTSHVLENNLKNSGKVGYSDQASTETVEQMMQRDVPEEQAIRSKYSEAGLFTYTIADDAFYLDKRLYKLTNSIDPAFYLSDEHDWDAAVIRMVNAGKNQYNPRIRRIAKLAKAFKDSILAQTNDTNPFYSKPLSELFDRLSDYFLDTNHQVITIKTAEFWIKARDIINNGMKDYAPIYNALYDADFVVRLTAVLGRLKAALVGTYYDKTALSEYLTNGVPALAPRQNGGLRMFIPMYGTNNVVINRTSGWTEQNEPGVLSHADPILSHLLLPQIGPGSTDAAALIKRQQSRIINALEADLNRIYSTDHALIATALAAFNGVPALGPIQESPIRVSANIPLQLSNNVQMWKGSMAQYGKCNGEIKVYGVSRSSSNATVAGTDGYGGKNTYSTSGSMVLNYNGITSITTSGHSGEQITHPAQSVKLTDSFQNGSLSYAFQFNYGSSVNNMTKVALSAVGLSFAELVDYADTKRDFDIWGVHKPLITPKVSNEHVTVKQTHAWAGVKYKYTFCVHYEEYDSLCVANAIMHNGDTFVYCRGNLGAPESTAAVNLLEARICEGPCSVAAAWDAAGIYETTDIYPSSRQEWGAANLVSSIDNACVILTQSTTINPNDVFDRGVKGWVSNVGTGESPMPMITEIESDQPESGDRLLFNSASLWGVVYIDKPKSGTNLVGFTYDGVTPAEHYMNLFDGTEHYKLAQLYHTSYSKAQYMAGITNYSEESVN